MQARQASRRSPSLPHFPIPLARLLVRCRMPKCQMPETAPPAPHRTGTAPHRTRSSQRHSFKPPPLFPSFSFQPLHLASPPALAPIPAPSPVWLRRSRCGAGYQQTFFFFARPRFFFLGEGGSGSWGLGVAWGRWGIRYVGPSWMLIGFGFGMTRMTGRDAARRGEARCGGTGGAGGKEGGVRGCGRMGMESEM